MSLSHTITRGYRDTSGVTVQSSESITADSESSFDNSIAPSTTKGSYAFILTRSQLKSLMIYSDKVLSVFARAAATVAVEDTVNTNAVDAQIQITGHGLSVGQSIFLTGIGGSTNVNGWFYVKTVVDADHIKLSLTVGGATVQGNGAAYTSGGTLQKADVFNLTAGQNIIWNLAIDGLAACPLTNAATDAFLFTNGSGTDTAAAKIRALETV